MLVETPTPPLHQTGAVYACFRFVYFPVSLGVQSRAPFDVHQLLICKSVLIFACSSAALLRRRWREREREREDGNDRRIYDIRFSLQRS